MASVTLKGNPVTVSGELPAAGSAAPDFTAVKNDLSSVSLGDFAGKSVILNIFPSIDTGTCAASVRAFNQKAAGLENTAVVCLSMDLPFAHSRFCGAEGIENVVTASLFRDPEFRERCGVAIADGPLAGLCARAVVVIKPDGSVAHSQLVGEIVDEPDYDAALAALG